MIARCPRYSGYYVFTLTSKDGVTKDATAKFTYILRKTPNGVRPPSFRVALASV